MNIVLNLVAVAASVIGAGMALPQAISLFTTRRTDGVSPMWIGVSLAINAWWAAYALAASVTVLLPVAVASFVLYAAIGVIFVRAERDAGRRLAPTIRSMAIGAFALGLGPLPGLVIGGWHTAGIAIGLCYGVQLLPAVIATFRTRELSGVSNGTWILSFVEGLLWLIYGVVIVDGALIAGGVTGVLMAGIILARLDITGHRPFAITASFRPAFAR